MAGSKLGCDLPDYSHQRHAAHKGVSKCKAEQDKRRKKESSELHADILHAPALVQSVLWECQCVISYERDREKWGQHDKSASVVKALQTSCHSIQSGLLCSKSHYHKALHTWTMSPFWNILCA